MLADSRLDAGFLIRANHELAGLEGPALPFPGIEIEDASGLGGEARITRKDPAAVLPRADGVLIEPTPHRLITEGSNDTAALCLANDVCGAQA